MTQDESIKLLNDIKELIEVRGVGMKIKKKLAWEDICSQDGE